jgi:hypothetical protein
MQVAALPCAHRGADEHCGHGRASCAGAVDAAAQASIATAVAQTIRIIMFILPAGRLAAVCPVVLTGPMSFVRSASAIEDPAIAG